MIESKILHSPSRDHWQRIGIHNRHGICVPLFSLHSQKSSGIGDFNDLFQLIDWCHELKLEVLQLLPINEMDDDHSPYRIISSLALDPIYIGLESNEEFKKLNELPYISYDEVRKKKMEKLHHYFVSVFKKDKDFFNFVESHPWLHSYVANKSEKDFYLFLQYLAFSQMLKVKEYASSKNVLILGDIPLFVSQNSIDVQLYPNLFDKNYVAGAPPDSYNPMGQKWNFFTFNWSEHKKQNYSWWQARLKAIEDLYHLYRIDHIVGFFRIFAMKPNNTPHEGELLPKDRSLWGKEGRERLLFMLNSSPLLPIAEDLGFIPEETYDTLEELAIPGTKVMRWWKKDYDPISLTTISTHDSETLQMWWENNPKEALVFAKEKNWTYAHLLSFNQRFELLRDSHKTKSLFHINLLNEYLALFPELIWKDYRKERINIPGSPSSSNWIYKFKPSIEEICSHSELKKQMRLLIN